MVAMNLQSCNKKDEPDSSTSTDYTVYSSASTMVSSFSLKDNSKILANLSNVKFAIDQERGLIYNADSLPKGTRVNALCVDLTCASTVSSRQFIVKNGSVQGDTTITFTSSSRDSIDFTGDVTLRIISRDGNHTRDYKVSVNVHKLNPDTITWPVSQRRELPDVNGTLTASKTVALDDSFVSMVHDAAGYALLAIDTLMNEGWEKKTLALPFTPQVKSFAATSDAIYLLDTNGELFKSTNLGTDWTDCGVAWQTIVGGYDNKLLGVMRDGEQFKHDEYPRSQGFVPSQVPQGFPVTAMSQLVMASNEWTSQQQAMIAGGVLSSGALTNNVWGYDGKRWGLLNQSGGANVLPKLHDAVLLKYYTCTFDDSYSLVKRHTWMVMGGVLENGSYNTVTYTSVDQGLHWNTGSTGVQKPDYMPSFLGAQAFTVVRRTSRSNAPRLLSYNPGQITPLTEWDSPYVYLFGGYGDSGNALNNVWEGVLTGVTYRPVY